MTENPARYGSSNAMRLLQHTSESRVRGGSTHFVGCCYSCFYYYLLLQARLLEFSTVPYSCLAPLSMHIRPISGIAFGAFPFSHVSPVLIGRPFYFILVQYYNLLQYLKFKTNSKNIRSVSGKEWNSTGRLAFSAFFIPTGAPQLGPCIIIYCKHYVYM